MDTPIIKAFMYENKCYFYDTYTNRLFGLTTAQYKEICELMKLGCAQYLTLNKGTESYNDILMLMRKGLLRSNYVNEIEHPETKYVHDLLNGCLSDIVLQVTRDCNFSCRYCLFANNTKINRMHEKKYMTYEMAKKSIDFLYNHSAESNHITISFYGGEPLLNFKLIVQVVNYVESIFFTKNIKFIMTVNGSLLTHEILEFITKHNFHITISLDGAEKIQNKHRRFLNSGCGTYKVVYTNVNFMRTQYPTFFANNVSFCPVVIDDENFDEVLSFFKEVGIPEEKVNPLKANLSGIDYIYAAIGSDNSNLKKVSFDYDAVNQRSIKDLKRIYSDKHVIPSVWHHNGPCVPAQHRLFIDINGNFYPCEKMIENRAFIIGNIKNGLDDNRIINFLNIGRMTEVECKTCWAAHFCQICVTLCNDVDNNKLSKEQKIKACQVQKDVALWFLKRHILENNSN